MGDVPRLGLGLGGAPPPSLMALALEIGRRMVVADLGDCLPTDPAIVRAEWSRPPDHDRPGPQVWWLDRPDQVPEAGAAVSPVLVVSGRADVVRAATASGLAARIVPETEGEPESAPVAPFVRERLRQARGLGAGLLVQDRPARWRWDGRVDVPAARVSTALAAAAAACVASPEGLVRGLAWGCPMVAPLAVIEAAGAEPGRHVLEAKGTDPVQQLTELAAEVRLSARLSREGRARYETAHSVVRAADDVLAALGVATHWIPSSLQRRLEELDARRGDAQRHRAADMVGGIVDWEEPR